MGVYVTKLVYVVGVRMHRFYCSHSDKARLCMIKAYRFQMDAIYPEV